MVEQWILQETEFQILAAVMGIENIYGIRPKQELGESEVMYTVHEMAKKGILLPEGSSLRIIEPYRQAFRSIKTAKRILAVTGSDDKLTDACFYLGKQMVVLEKSQRDEHAVRICMAERSMLYEQLCDREFLPEPFWDPDMKGLQKEEELAAEEQSPYAVYRVFDTTHKMRGPYKVFTLLYALCDYWVSEEEGGLVCYDRKRFCERLTDVLKGVC